MKNFFEKIFEEALNETLAEALNETLRETNGEKIKEQSKNEITSEELKEAAKPLVELLQKKGHAHMTAIITTKYAEITEGKVGVPFAGEQT